MNKILFLSANPEGTVRLGLAEEIKMIDNAIMNAAFHDQFVLVQEHDIRTADLQELLLTFEPNIVHFSGHGSKESSLIFENESGNATTVSRDTLTDLFRLINQDGDIQCVILNACYSEEQAEAIGKYVSCVIGMSAAIPDEAAIKFSTSFYRGLASGRSIKNAFELGCNDLEMNFREFNIPKLKYANDKALQKVLANSNQSESHGGISRIKSGPRFKKNKLDKTQNFIGRKNFMHKIREMMAHPAQPISIIGEAGLGKSQLAYEAIDTYQNAFSDVIIFDFTNFIKYEKFLGEFAYQLGLVLMEFEKLEDDDKSQEILDNLSKRKHVLIYADNFETISNIFSSKKEESNLEDAQLILQLLNSVPNNVLILTTSRIRRNNLYSERTVELDGLSKEEGREMFLKLAPNQFPPKPLETIIKLLEQISEKTGGHPLSLELLARSYNGNGITELKKMLNNLGIGLTNPTKQNIRFQSLENSFAISLDALDEVHVKQLPKLAIFSSYFTPQGVQEIFGIDHDSLQEFYDHGLLRRIDFDEENPLEFRLYHFHLATKNYLQRQVNMNSLKSQVKEKFIQYYDKLADHTYKSLSNKYRIQSVKRFRTIMQNENDFEKAALLNESKSTSIYANLCLVLKNLGNLSDALEYAQMAKEIAEKNEEETIIARSYANLGQVLQAQGKPEEALEYTRMALEIAEKNPEEGSLAVDYNNIGQILQAQGKPDEAIEYMHEALKIAEKNSSEVSMARYNNNIGQILYAQGKPDEALKYAIMALKIAEKNNDEWNAARYNSSIGQILHAQGKPDEALKYAIMALKIAEKNNDEGSLAVDYNNIGQILHAQGKPDEAIEYMHEALKIAEKNNDEWNAARYNSSIGHMLYAQNKPKAINYLHEALKIAEKNNDEVIMIIDYNTIGHILHAQGKYEETLKYTRMSLKIAEKKKDVESIKILYDNIYQTLQDLKK